ncbi:jg5425, partial [Pararge aegeria aegeria]
MEINKIRKNSNIRGLEGPQGEEERGRKREGQAYRLKIVLPKPTEEEKVNELLMDTDSDDSDRVLEALVEPWKVAGAVSKRPHDQVDSREEEEGEPSLKAVAVEPETESAVTTKAKIKVGRARAERVDEGVRERSPINRAKVTMNADGEYGPT